MVFEGSTASIPTVTSGDTFRNLLISSSISELLPLPPVPVIPTMTEAVSPAAFFSILVKQRGRLLSPAQISVGVQQVSVGVQQVSVGVKQISVGVKQISAAEISVPRRRLLPGFRSPGLKSGSGQAAVPLPRDVIFSPIRAMMSSAIPEIPSFLPTSA